MPRDARRLGGIILIGLALIADHASAALVTYRVDGFVTSADAPIASVAPGDLYTLTYTIDDSVADTNADPTIGVYPGAVTCYTLGVGGYFVQGDGQVTVMNFPSQDDVLVEDGSPTGAMLDGLTPSHFTLTLLSDVTATALTSDAIPVLTEVPPLNPVQFELSFEASVVIGAVTSVQEVGGSCPSPGPPVCPPASADSANYQVDGVVNAVDPFPYPFVLPGEPFSATFSIDHSVADSDPDPTIGVYPGAVSCYTMEIGGNIVQGNGEVVVRNLPGQDDVFVGDKAPTAPLGGAFPFLFALTRQDDVGGSALANDAIPVLTAFSPVSAQQFVLGFVDPSPALVFVHGDITSIQVDHALTLTKDVSAFFVSAGSTIGYWLTATNVGSFDAASVAISDIVPADTAYVAGSASDGGSENGGIVSWPAISVAPTQSVLRSFIVKVDPGLIVPPADFWDDMEAGASNWTTSHAVGSNNWQLVGTNPHSGAASWFGEDVSDLSDQLLTVFDPILLPLGASQLEFFHDYSLESGFDGGVVEISTDGVLWTDLGSHAIENPYDGTISTCCLSPILGSPAFTGSSGGFIRSIFDLTAFAGSEVRIRFRLATDDSVADVGWWVDDVVVRVPVAIVNDALAEPAEGPTAWASTRSEVTLIPEPSRWMLLAAGLLWLAAIGRRRYRP